MKCKAPEFADYLGSLVCPNVALDRQAVVQDSAGPKARIRLECRECGRRVDAHKESTNGRRAHFEHRRQ